MASIYLVASASYYYSNDFFDGCYVYEGSGNVISAFTFPELANEYCNELNVKYYRENHIMFSDYTPGIGSNKFSSLNPKIEKLPFKLSCDNPEEFKVLMNQLSDSEVLSVIHAIDLPFYVWYGVSLYA